MGRRQRLMYHPLSALCSLWQNSFHVIIKWRVRHVFIFLFPETP